MRTDPKPDHRVLTLDAHGTPANTHTHRKDGAPLTHLLKIQTGVCRVVLPEAIVLARELLDTPWQTAKTPDEILGQMEFTAHQTPADGCVQPRTPGALAPLTVRADPLTAPRWCPTGVPRQYPRAFPAPVAPEDPRAIAMLSQKLAGVIESSYFSPVRDDSQEC